ncbi:hypothetical protein HHX38_18915 [Streptomyces sp. PKU-MA01144]|uniref:hypothetical protein n=1 Tax=Streptomyces sp. PKU-MA01144 TaxID=2729138 RepID=UPI001480EAA9|nr:hypothetical protein [Streptomyces sp. PKU-MA01144]NNJ06180.1 hypothetical protein [Streptomyces sp. PKU-MA01144]
MENRNWVNHDLFYGKDGDLIGSDKESQEASMEPWTHAEHLVACLQRKVSPRESPGGVLLSFEGFPTDPLVATAACACRRS